MPPAKPLPPSARCSEMFSSPSIASSPSSPSTSCAALAALTARRRQRPRKLAALGPRRRRRPYTLNLTLLSLLLSLSILRKHLHCRTHGMLLAPYWHLCRARTRMREIWSVGGAWRVVARTQRARPRSLCRRRASCSCLAQRMIDGPLSGPKRQKLVGERQRAHDSRHRRSPDVLMARPYRSLGPSGQPLRRPPIAPIVGLERVCIAIQLTS